jgi:hypothetical protein
MNHNRIKALQKIYGFDTIQEQINSGLAWRLEGSVGRHAMQLLESGVCMLPKKKVIDYYGNTVPSRDMIKKGTKGSFLNSKKFWCKVESGEVTLD